MDVSSFLSNIYRGPPKNVQDATFPTENMTKFIRRLLKL